MPRHTARGVAAGNVAFGLEKGRKVTAAGQAPKVSRRKGVRFRNHNLQNFTENTKASNLISTFKPFGSRRQFSHASLLKSALSWYGVDTHAIAIVRIVFVDILRCLLSFSTPT